ncbi:MAG: succinate dehydrogenase cytochrome b subunit [Bacteroidota bacterium]
MNWFVKTFSSTLGRKLLVALTGIFLILFLVVHLAGNLQLLKNDEGEAFNIYAHTMASNPLIKVVSILNFAFIALHAIVALVLARYNKKARPVSYAVNAGSSNSSWASRNMAVLGLIVLVFILVHLKGFWYENKFGSIEQETYPEVGAVNNLYKVVDATYAEWWYVLFYVACMGFVAFHLFHGFQSAFQTLGLNHVKYTPVIKKIGVAFAIVVPLLFAVIPIVMFVKNMG